MSIQRTERGLGMVGVGFIVVVTAATTFGILALLENIRDRKDEAKQSVFAVTQLDETTIDPAEWGKNFPRQYDSYKRTVDVERTRFGGSEAFQHLDEDPVWRTIFAGYAFAIDYREERGHAYMLTDQRETERVTKKAQPGACLHCHASNVVAYREAGIKAGAAGTLAEALTSEAGWAQLQKGFETVCALPYADATALVKHPVACLDCHDPKTQQLRITKPAFVTGLQALARSGEALPHFPSIERWRHGDKAREYDPNTEASRQELRSMVCGQCHVEYYFKGDGKLVTFPWHNGLRVEHILAYYQTQDFKDWTHAISGASTLKAQHPEFETWSQGVHARSGVACADCHMPYVREGAVKVSDHHVRSPMLNVARACQTCHHFPEDELRARVVTIQERTKALLDRAEIAVVSLIHAIDSAKKSGATDAQLAAARAAQRTAQFKLDFVSAENSMGFHAPQETARVLAESIDEARQGEILILEIGKAK